MARQTTKKRLRARRPPAKRPRVPEALVERALRETLGNCSAAAGVLAESGYRISRQAVWARLEASDRLKEAVAEADAQIRADALSGMGRLIRDGNGPMVRWYLDRKAKDLGFGR